jgi:hypothetical protein
MLDVTVEDNDFVTNISRSGPSNPDGLRLSPSVQDARDGVVRGTFARNRIRGPVPYPIMIHGGMPQRLDGVPPASGKLYLSFENNLLDDAASQGFSVITFTNARAIELVCELDPDSVPANCPMLMSRPDGTYIYWDYLKNALFDIHHTAS